MAAFVIRTLQDESCSYRHSRGWPLRVAERAEAWSRSLGINQMRTTVHTANTLGVAAWTWLGFSPSSYNMTKWLEAPP